MVVVTIIVGFKTDLIPRSNLDFRPFVTRHHLSTDFVNSNCMILPVISPRQTATSAPPPVSGIRAVHRFLDGVSAGEPVGVLLRMASRLQVAPALLAKFVLNCYVKEADEEYRVLNDRGKRQRLGQLMREPEGLDDPQVAAEIRLCVLSDNGYGPMAEMIKQ